MRAICTAGIVVTCVAAAVAGGVELQTVHFEYVYPTTFGDSLFVLGDLPELGNNELINAVKMVPLGSAPGGTRWAVDIAIPQGEFFTYRYYVRDDTITALANPGNGSPVVDPSVYYTDSPERPLRALTVYVAAALGQTSITLETIGGPAVVPLAPAPGSPDYLVATLAGQPNQAWMLGQVGTKPIDAWADTLLLRDVSLYNYWPASFSFPAGAITTHTLPTTTVPQTRTVDGVTGRGFRVYTPRGYAAQPWKRYPVLYMHDGQNVFRPGGPFGSWDAEFAANVAIRDARIRELLIVAVDNSSQRSAEYVPELGNGTVNNDDYNSFLINELKPWIDANYRTLPDRENTGVMGSSFGGIASLSLGLDHGDVFGLVGAMSTSFWVGATRSRMEGGDFPADVRLYLDAGDTSDGGDATVAVRDSLLTQGRVLEDDFCFQIGYGQQHNEQAWKQRMPVALEALYPLRDEANGLERRRVGVGSGPAAAGPVGGVSGRLP